MIGRWCILPLAVSRQLLYSEWLTVWAEGKRTSKSSLLLQNQWLLFPATGRHKACCKPWQGCSCMGLDLGETPEELAPMVWHGYLLQPPLHLPKPADYQPWTKITPVTQTNGQGEWLGLDYVSWVSGFHSLNSWHTLEVTTLTCTGRERQVCIAPPTLFCFLIKIL